MVTENRQRTATDHQVQALARVRAVADDVPEADDTIDALLLNVSQYGGECFEVAVDVTDQGLSHVQSLLVKGRVLIELFYRKLCS